MKELWRRNRKIIILLCLWRIALFAIEKYSPFFVPQHLGYNGPIPWANHDGIYYLFIAERGYIPLSEAFFPLYPMLIYMISRFNLVPYGFIGASISFVSFVTGIFILYNELYKENKTIALWTVIFLIAFPTSFFFSAVYAESIFFLLTVLVYVCTKRKLWFWAGIFGAFASATKLFGVLLIVYVGLEYIVKKPKKWLVRDILSVLLVPAGLVAYMIYLYVKRGDPLLFFHMQPLFGANRSSSMIFLPQVVWRYLKILFTAFLQPTPASYVISVLEFISVCFGYSVLYYGWKMKERLSLVVFGICVITIPTLTGTFSSMPRYLLAAFPLFFILGKLDNKPVRYTFLCIFIIFQIMLSAMFLRGWFVA